MSDCNTNKDCDDCQKTLKDHLRECADYGKNPPLIEKCEQLPGGCSAGKPECCPAPPPACPEPCPPPSKCNPPPTATFTCPASDCGPKDCPPPAAKCCPPPPTKVEQCKPKKEECPPKKEECPPSSPKKNDNNCDPRPLAMEKKK